MSPSRASLAVLCCLSGAISTLLATPAQSDPGLSDQGYTGYTNTPSAYVTPDGRLQMLWSDALSGARTRAFENYTQADNYLVSFGMFPRLELGLRLTNTGDDDFRAGLDTRFSDSEGQRDLSTNIKAQLFDSDIWPSLAIGRQDASGNGLFSATYGVASYRWRMLEASLGYGDGRFDGVFYGVSARLGRYGRVMYDDDNTQRVLAIEAHTADLVRGVRLLGRYRAVASGRQAETGLALGLEMDLGLARRWSARAVSGLTPEQRETQRTRITRLQSRAAGGEQGSEACASIVEAEAGRAGLERVSVRRISSPDGESHWVLAAEGIRFTHSPVDAVGVALGILAASCAAEPADTLVIQLTEHGAPRLWTAAAHREVLQYFTMYDAPPASLLFGLGAHELYSGLGGRDGVIADIQLAPRLRYTVGTEANVLDYSVGVETVATIPLWWGGAAVIEGVDDVAASNDVRPGGPLQSFALPNGIVSRGVQQVVPIGRYGAIRGYFGRSDAFGQPSDVTVAEAWVAPLPDIGLQLETRYSEYEFRLPQLISNGRLPPSRRSAWVSSLRYFLGEQETMLELTWGRFHFEDEGARVRLERFFADTSVSMTYLRDKDKENEALSVGLSLPFGGRRSVAMGPVAVGGSGSWGTTLQTIINAESNFLRPNLLREVVPPGSLGTQFFDRDRLTRVYFQSQWPRMRYAFESYVPAF